MGIHTITKGLDLPLAGNPEQVIHAGPEVTRVALLGADYVGLRPTFEVQVGERVRRGQILFEHKKTPGVVFTAPATGTIEAIHRGEKRAFQSIVISLAADDRAESQVMFASYSGAPPETLDADAVRALLVESGLWTALRTRPFSKIPALNAGARAIFVTAIDTRPHAPAVDVVLAERMADFQAGLTCLSKLCAGPTFLCVAPGAAIPVPVSERVRVETFAGPHPAGIAGTHIHCLCPVDLERAVWHIGYQDVAAIGRLFMTGELEVERVISLAGPGVTRPRLLRTRLGAATDELTRGEIAAGEHRVIAGSVLDGRTAAGEAHSYLGRHHLQVSVLSEGREREFFGWVAPGANKHSVWGVVLGAWQQERRFALTTTTNGGQRAMVPIGSFERVMPLDLLPTFLLRALLSGDIERAEALGCLELDEEDLALCTYVCPGKAEYGPLLRAALARIEKEQA